MLVQHQVVSQISTMDVVGDVRNITVAGCAHATVGRIVRGTFTLSSQNHGKPVYKKDTQVNNLDVMLYFWDQRDGASFSGWWFGPQVGGDQVWAYHPKDTPSPPKSGYHVPCDGPIDTTMTIGATSSAPASAPQQAQPAQQAQQQQPWSAPWSPPKGGKDSKGKGGKDSKGSKDFGKGFSKDSGKSKGGKDSKGKGKGKDDKGGKGKGKSGGKGGGDWGGGWDALASMMGQMQEEWKKKAEEDKKKAEEESAKRKSEQGAAMNIRRVIQKVRGATEEGLEPLKKELDEILSQELETCGSMKTKLKEEAEQSVMQTVMRIEATKKAMAEAEEKRKELQDKAEKVLKEMASLVADAEMEAQAVKEAGEPLSADGADLEDIKEAAEAVGKAGEEAKAKLKICTDFSKENGKNMHVPQVAGGTDNLVEWGKLLTRTKELARETDQAMKQAAAAKVSAEKKSEAIKKMKAWTDVFDKYDKKKSGYLSKANVKSYAQAVLQFKIQDGPLEEIFAALSDDPKGIAKDAEQLLRLKIAIGCAREKVEDDMLRKEREEKEKMLAEMKAELQEKANGVLQVITRSEGLVATAEKATLPLPAKAKELSSTDMLQLSDEVEAAIKEAKADIAEATSALEGLKEDVDEALKTWLLVEVNKLHAKTVGWEPRLAKATSSCSTFRDKAKNKEREELEALEVQAIGMIRYHQQEEKLSKEQMFEQFDADKDGSVSEADFIKFFTACKKDEAKNEDGTTPPKKDPPSEEALKRVFKQLDEDEEGSLSKERLGVIVRRLMKVASETAISSGMSIKDKESKTVRRLELDEVVDVLEGPIEDETAGVLRVRAKAMKDGAEGWISLKGNKGTDYLVDGGFLFKVVKDTIMTAAFELDAPVDKNKKDPTRKLKEGELLEVREWPKLEEKSNLTRMKCKAKSDGLVGWVTTVGNAGTVFVSMV